MLATLSILAGFTAAVVGYDGPRNQPHIMGASGASATTAAGPNGTSYFVEVSETGTEGNISDEAVTLVEKSENSINFTGKIQAPTPCHTVSHNVDEEDNSLELNITMESSDQPCTEQVVMKNYEGFAEMEGLENLSVSHRGEEMAVFETESEEPIKEEPKKSGFMSGVMKWFSGIF